MPGAILTKFCVLKGATENAGMENVGPNRMGGNRRTGKRRTKIPGMEKAELENAGTSCVWVAKRNIINVHVFLKAVSHSMGAHSRDLYSVCRTNGFGQRLT